MDDVSSTSRTTRQGLDQARYGAPPLAPTGERLAHPGLRAAAFAIDGFTTILVATLVVFGAFPLKQDVVVGFGMVGVPMLAALAATVSTAIRGTTLGKHALGLRVIDARTGDLIGWRAVPRSLVIVAPLLVSYGLQRAFESWTLWSAALVAGPTVPVLLWLVLLLILGLAPRHRGLQDLAGRSIVVHAPDRIGPR
jgi:uncharacterized RDD family membrane protein YckC